MYRYTTFEEKYKPAFVEGASPTKTAPSRFSGAGATSMLNEEDEEEVSKRWGCIQFECS